MSLRSGGSGKAEGLADGEWANHRQVGACRCHPARPIGYLGINQRFETRNSKLEIATGGGFSLLEVVLTVAIIAVVAAVAIPRYGRAGGRYQADLAARRVAADLRQAQLYARTSSASCTVTFTVGQSQYEIANAPAFDGSVGTYTVDLRVPPYKATIVSAIFGGSNPKQVTFTGWGLPDKAGTVVVSVGSEQRTVTLNRQTGQVTVQ